MTKGQHHPLGHRVILEIVHPRLTFLSPPLFFLPHLFAEHILPSTSAGFNQLFNPLWQKNGVGEYQTTATKLRETSLP